jgi:plasmid maintenance system killer protein
VFWRYAFHGSRSSPVSHGRLKIAALPGNALEPLRGGRKGQYSIRINDQ